MATMSAPHADVLIVNGRVFTGDPRQPWAAAVAVHGTQIAWVGTNEDAAAWRGPHTDVIDAAGATVMPGFIDSHFHLLWGSLKLDSMQLDAVTDLDGLAATVQAWAVAHPADEWLLGYQLRYNIIPPDRPLDRHFLDSIVADRPVFLTAYDGHTVWANTRALEIGGLLYGAAVPAGSVILMAADGTATGELREPGAFNPIRDRIPQPDPARKRALLQKGLARCASLGITSVHNMDGDREQVDLYVALEAAGEMTVRVYVPYSFKPETPLDALHEAAEWKRTVQGSHVRVSGIKLFMDGVVEAYTALMLEEYAGMPGNTGGALFSAEHFNQVAVEADRLGLQIAVHACGDGAVRRALDGFALARQINGPRDSRHRIEHVEIIHPDDMARFAELGVVASMQPLHAPLTVRDADVWPRCIGEQRWRYSFPWQMLREAGARLAFGSDWPVVSMDPMLGLWAGTNRRPWQAGDPDQAQSLADLLAGYTRDAAYVEFQEQHKGILAAGMLADVVVLDADLFTMPPAELCNVKPVVTLCDGKVVYRRGG